MVDFIGVRSRQVSLDLYWVVYKQFPETNEISRSSPPDELQAKMTLVSCAEFDETPHCLVKNTVALQGS